MSVVRLDLLTPPFFAAAGLVVASGSAKLRHPLSAVSALEALRLPSGRWTVRGIGVVEIMVGMWCLFSPGRASAVSMGLLYASFATFLGLLKRAGAHTSCGCLGTREVPPSLLHLAMNAVAAASAALMASGPPPGILAYSARLPLRGVPFLLGTALIAYVAYLLVAYLPAAFWAYDRPAGADVAAVRPRRFALRPTEDR
ncbi:MAG TPA: MauE/DoxX family redox-associated membrane protein [Actinomycetota bacterium]|nr:MauE/DoxX family redox-associated membrane protein [Actinomycetota bacterium]